MSKKRIPKAPKKRLIVFGSASVVIILYFFVQLFSNIYSIYNLNSEHDALKKDYKNLKFEEKDLKNEIEKLNDSDYIARYAREEYSYSKNGEYVLKIKEEDKKEDNKKFEFNLNIDYQYIIIGVGIIILLLIIKALKKE